MSTSPDSGTHRSTTAPARPSAQGLSPAEDPPAVKSPPPVADRIPAHPAPAPDHPQVIHSQPDHADVLKQQKARFGGIRWGSAFFGWLTAIGTAVLLTGLVTSVGAAFGLATTNTATQAAGQVGEVVQNPGAAQTTGIAAAIVALVILLVAYYCGGYVAGRMARFNGMKQGIAVWVWTIVITVIGAILIAVAGARFNVLGAIGGLPQLPIDSGALTIAGIIAALVALAVSLIGAILGGLAGMRFHRNIDRTDLDHDAHRSTGGNHAGSHRV